MYDDFAKWLDGILVGEMPGGIKAFNFNIYEEDDGSWSLQLIGSSYYDPDNDDWACDELYSSEEDIYTWTEESEDAEWTDAQQTAVSMISDYLQNGEKKDVLLSSDSVCAGFVDGDLILIYPFEEE